MAGGTDRIEEGFKLFGKLNQKVVGEYLQRLTAAGMPERRARLNPKLQQMLAGQMVLDFD